MRVIGGIAKGQPLKSIPGKKTRPTTDRVKESMFNLIQQHLHDRRILDLFAGSGALGIESLSRGAESCCFVDENRGSILTIRENLKKTKFHDHAAVIQMDYLLALDHLSTKKVEFDVIFLDPPYEREFVKSAVDEIISRDLLTDGGIIVVEQDKREQALEEGKGITLWKERTYGNTTLRIYTR